MDLAHPLTSMTASTSLAAGTLASLIAMAIGAGAGYAWRDGTKIVPRHLFWNRFKKDLQILISEVPNKYDPSVRPGAQPPLTPIGDAIALSQLLHFLRTETESGLKVSSVQSVVEFDRIKDHNLLIIGGPKYNTPCSLLLTQLDPHLPYQYMRLVSPQRRRAEDSHLKRFHSRVNGQPDLTCSPHDDIDFGMILVCRNPYNHDAFVICAGGLSTLSTIACAKWLTKMSLHDTIKARQAGTGLQIIVKCRSVDAARVTGVTTERRALFNQR